MKRTKPTAGVPETRIESALVLRVYQKIVDQGDRRGERFELEGLSAVADYDGYGIMLTDGAVSVRVLFHNKVQIESPNRRALANFRKRLLRIGALP